MSKISQSVCPSLIDRLELNAEGNNEVIVVKALKYKDPKEIHQFKDMEEFNKYYQVNKEEVDKLTTTAINKTFHVEGYKLAIYKGKLVGKPAQKVSPPSPPPLPPIPIVETKDDELDEMILKRLEVIEAKLKTVTDEIPKMKKSIKQLIDIVNQD